VGGYRKDFATVNWPIRVEILEIHGRGVAVQRQFTKHARRPPPGAGRAKP